MVRFGPKCQYGAAAGIKAGQCVRDDAADVDGGAVEGLAADESKRRAEPGQVDRSGAAAAGPFDHEAVEDRKIRIRRREIERALVGHAVKGAALEQQPRAAVRDRPA